MGHQIDHADFEDDMEHGSYLEDVAYGITIVSIRENGELVLVDEPVNFEQTTHDRGTTLAVVGGLSSFWDTVFPAETTFIVEINLHHAPNAVGSYTITTEVQDDKTQWV